MLVFFETLPAVLPPCCSMRAARPPPDFKVWEGAGEHKGHPGEADIRPLGFAGHIDPRQPQLFNKMPGLGEGEKVHGRFPP